MIAFAFAAALAQGPAPSVGIQAGNVCLGTPAQPGASYRLGIYVQDTGTGPETAGLQVLPLARGEQVYRGEHQISPLWASAPSVQMAAGQGTTIPFTLTIPQSAAGGIYVADIWAGPVSQPQAGSGVLAQLGSGGQAYLIFRVGPGVQPSCTLPPPAGSPSAALYARKQPRPEMLSWSWYRKHEPWLFSHGSRPSAPAVPAPQAVSGSGPSAVPRAAVVLVTALGMVLAGMTAAARRRRPR